MKTRVMKTPNPKPQPQKNKCPVDPNCLSHQDLPSFTPRYHPKMGLENVRFCLKTDFENLAGFKIGCTDITFGMDNKL